MPSQFSLGIEEEFQTVDSQTGHLCSRIQMILEKGATLFGEKIKPEMLQSAVEIVTGVCPDITAARTELSTLRQQLIDLLRPEQISLISAGTHPGDLWQDQSPTTDPRYAELEEELQDVARSVLIFGLHVHVGVKDQATAVQIMNQARTWLPHLLALSSNSPFWAGRLTNIKSYRSVVWRSFPRSGIPDTFPSWHDFDNYVQTLIHSGIIDNGKKIWWDIRPHPFFDTIEFRVCDMPATLEDTLAVAALCQALVARLVWLHEHGMSVPILPRTLIEENKWKAIRYGLDAEVLDFTRDRRLSMRASISELLDFVDDMVDDLGSRREFHYLRTLLTSSHGTGADRQIDVYKRTGTIGAVTDYLIQQTQQSVSPAPQQPDRKG